MAKTTKSPTPEFLENRRKAIMELAKKRRKETLIRTAGVTSEANDSKVTPRYSLSSAPPPPSQS